MSIQLNQIQSKSSCESPRPNDRVAILGYGNYGKALGSRFNAAGIPFVVGRRNQETRYSEPDINCVAYDKAAEDANIIFLAMPAHAYDDVIPPLSSLLVGKIIIDVSNAENVSDNCNAVHLASLLPDSKIVKALNTISAWALQNDLYGASRSTYVCSDDADARKTVMQIARDIGFTPIDSGRLAAAAVLEKKVLQLFPEWRVPFWITFSMLLFQIIYLHGRYLISHAPEKLLNSIFLKYPNRITGWMVLWLLAVVFLPGCIAAFLQLKRGTKYSMFPNWLDIWMKARKGLGLFALMFVGMHMCLSCILLAGEYYSGMSNVEFIQGTGKDGQPKQKLYHKYQWKGEVSLLFATLSTTLLVILGLTSLPTVNQSMSWREWDFIQSKLGYLSMLFGFLHIFFYVYKGLAPKHVGNWGYLPHHTFLMLLLPFIVMMLKLILMMPGINGMLRKIRRGWERHITKIHTSQI